MPLWIPMLAIFVGGLLLWNTIRELRSDKEAKHDEPPADPLRALSSPVFFALQGLQLVAGLFGLGFGLYLLASGDVGAQLWFESDA